MDHKFKSIGNGYFNCEKCGAVYYNFDSFSDEINDSLTASSINEKKFGFDKYQATRINKYTCDELILMRILL